VAVNIPAKIKSTPTVMQSEIVFSKEHVNRQRNIFRFCNNILLCNRGREKQHRLLPVFKELASNCE